MKHLFKKIKHLPKTTKRRKPSNRFQQPTAAEKPAAIAAGPSGLRAEQDVVPDGGQILSCCGLMDCPDVTVLLEDGSEIVPQTPFQSGAEDADQDRLASEAGCGDADHWRRNTD